MFPLQFFFSLIFFCTIFLAAPLFPKSCFCHYVPIVRFAVGHGPGSFFFSVEIVVTVEAESSPVAMAPLARGAKLMTLLLSLPASFFFQDLLANRGWSWELRPRLCPQSWRLALVMAGSRAAESMPSLSACFFFWHWIVLSWFILNMLCSIDRALINPPSPLESGLKTLLFFFVCGYRHWCLRPEFY